MKLLVWLGLALAVSLASSAEMAELQSPRTNNWGTWRGWFQCEEGTYAAGIQIKAEAPQDFLEDDTGLNAVALYCLPLNWDKIGSAWIMSGEGRWGDWQAVKWCPRGQMIMGFQLRSEPTKKAGMLEDDVAAVNFAAFCGSPFTAPDLNNYIMGDTPEWGEWTNPQFCPQSYAVCGIKSQIDEGSQGGGDDTSLNNVDLRCCEVESSCVPDAELVTVDSFDNTDGPGEMKYEYTVRTSFTKTTSKSETMSTHEKTIIGNKISSEIGAEDSGLSSKLTGELSVTLERGSTRSLQTMVQETSQQDTEKKLFVDIPKGTKSIIKQLVFTCGGYRIAVAKTLNQQNESTSISPRMLLFVFFIAKFMFSVQF